MPAVASVELIGVHLHGEEDDYFDEIPTDYRHPRGVRSLGALVDQSGAESIHWTIPDTLGFHEDLSPERLEAYRTQSGRIYPKLYRWKVTVEAEQLSEEETVRLWEEHKRVEEEWCNQAEEPDVIS